MNKHYELYKDKVEDFKKEYDAWNSNITDAPEWIKQTFIDIADGEIERLKTRAKGWLGTEEDGSDRHPAYDELWEQIFCPPSSKFFWKSFPRDENMKSL